MKRKPAFAGPTPKCAVCEAPLCGAVIQDRQRLAGRGPFTCVPGQDGRRL